MKTKRTVVGIGEIRLSDQADGHAAVGLAADVARAASRIGHAGVAVSRLGQDRFADDIIASLREDGVDTSHLQSDPDSATARVVNPLLVRADSDSAHAAYGNLQWDYDLVDLAQRSDIVIFSTNASRSTQARSVIQQFLYECRTALRVIDLTDHRGDIDRATVMALAGSADMAIIDHPALDVLVRSVGDAVVEVDGRLGRLLREASLKLLVLLHTDADVRILTHDSSWCAQWPEDGLDTASLLRFLVAVLDGEDMHASVEQLRRNND